MSILKGGETTTIYEFSTEQIKELIAIDLQKETSAITVDYVIQEVGGDPLDRYPGTKQVTKIKVTVK